MKVNASDKFKYYRCNVLGLDVKEFRALQNGDTVDVDKKIYERHKQAFEVEEPPKKGGK